MERRSALFGAQEKRLSVSRLLQLDVMEEGLGDLCEGLAVVRVCIGFIIIVLRNSTTEKIRT